MAENVRQCPHCGNYVEGKRSSSFGKKMGKTAVKNLSGDGVKYGAAATGAAIGSIIPGVGTLLGGGIGYLVGLAGKTAANEAIDKKIDDMTGTEYIYKCPRCGHEF